MGAIPRRRPRLQILQNLVAPASGQRPRHAGACRCFPNLFDAHPPFQIDGNFGATAGITEMLLQSDDPHGTPTSLTPVESGSGPAFVHLLPALPSALPNGKISGLKARGGLEVSIAWANGKLTQATIESKEPKSVTLRYAEKESTIEVTPARILRVGADLKPI